jgi:hypothetical protein
MQSIRQFTHPFPPERGRVFILEQSMKKLYTSVWLDLLASCNLDQAVKDTLKDGIVTAFDHSNTRAIDNVIKITVRVPNKKDTSLVDQYLTHLPTGSAIISVID